jgi:hypothetical protein
LKNIKELLEQLTDYRLTCGQKVSMGIRVGYLQPKASSASPLYFKIQPAFAIKTLCFYSYTNITVIFP